MMNIVESIRRSSGRAWAVLLLTILALLPAASFASGGENVELHFSSLQSWFLVASLCFGLLAIVVGAMLIKSVTSKSEGSDKMKEVGGAILDGALAYLRQQLRLMSIFVLILGVGLFALFGQKYGFNVGGLIAGAFLLGVGCSYFAGFMGMKMAVQANMRTAHAALTSYKESLEIAFRAGAVAGLMTVGLGLLGATAIILFLPALATKILVGFGFGGSLAALFMRVGGGIYTKAADVGADLVGKVEAGIPEDDPRNPAVIADNVGDNVGDCAGMAADVFESYEVTLVAAIVLGAATASIFPEQVWMQLILFALMARGVGIIASIIGIFAMKGNDDLKSDPLVSIRKGFNASAGIAALLTFILAFVMMGGVESMGPAIKTAKLTPVTDKMIVAVRELWSARDEIAESKKIERYQVSDKDLMASAAAKKYKVDNEQGFQQIAGAMNLTEDQLPKPKELNGYSRIDVTNPPAALKEISVQDAAAPGQMTAAKFVDIASKLKTMKPMIYNYRVTQQVEAVPAGQGTPPQPAKTTTFYISRLYGEKEAKDYVEQARQQKGIKVEQLGEPGVAAYYLNKDNELAIGLEGAFEPLAFQPQVELNYYKMAPDKLNKLAEEFQKMQASPKPGQEMPKMPPSKRMEIAVVDSQPVEWWRFALCILFGILMAFAIEKMTDYYVSLHKQPVQEVAAVSTAGPAPMIIQGFAYGLESSVFSVLAIVLTLFAPLVIFPPGQYGGYILSFYGVALVGLGLLTTTGYILAMDTFGPISDNAQGVFEMSGAAHESPSGAKAVQHLDAAGNTTKALTKGFAIATAVVAAVALFHSFIEEGKLTQLGLRLEVPEIFLGMLVGAAAPYLFSAFSINAVGRASFQLINEVRRQFKADPGIMAGTSKPDYGKCVAIVTAAAQKELVGPGLLAILLPTLVAFGFAINKEPVQINGTYYNLVGAQALGGFLAGAIVSGQLLAVLLANSGGMWDNAKKLIEDGLYGGKGTDAHKAGVVCDTVGDPFKDTAGPALNPLIKVMNLVALLLVPVVIQPYGVAVQISVTVACVIGLLYAVYLSKKGSMSTELVAASGGTSPHEMAEAVEKQVYEEKNDTV